MEQRAVDDGVELGFAQAESGQVACIALNEPGGEAAIANLLKKFVLINKVEAHFLTICWIP